MYLPTNQILLNPKPMKPKIWTIIVFAFLAIIVFSYGDISEENLPSPSLWNIPFIFWSSFLVTLSVFVLTYLGFVLFSREESTNPLNGELIEN
jgi:hypothetical protein